MNKAEAQASSVGASDSYVQIVLTDTNIMYVEDNYGYDLQSFIGEVGGTLGLMLGLSFMSIIDLLEIPLKRANLIQ